MRKKKRIIWLLFNLPVPLLFGEKLLQFTENNLRISSKCIFNNNNDIQTGNLDIPDISSNSRICQCTTIGPYNDNKIRFDNRTTQWTTVRAYMWNGNTSYTVNYPGDAMTEDANEAGVWYIDYPTGATNIIFNNGSNTVKTLDLSLESSENYRKNQIFVPEIGNKIYLKFIFGNYYNRVYAHFSNSSSDFTAVDNNGNVHVNDDYEFENNNNGTATIRNMPSTNYRYLNFYSYDSGNLYWTSNKIDLGTNSNNARGHIYNISGTNDSSSRTCEYKGMGSSGSSSGSWNPSVPTWDWDIYSNSTTTAVQATYQPEDRYGMISNLNNTTPVTSGFTDDGNFIKVVLASGTTITKPYIKFLDSNGTVIILIDENI